MIFVSLPPAFACGPYNPIIPTPDYFYLKNPKRISDYDREENLKLWQALIPGNIPLPDIEQVIYKDSRETFCEYVGEDSMPSSNLMYTYINNTNDIEVYEFIAIAKDIEEKWHKQQSPWYYPRDMDHSSDLEDFQYDINKSKNYRGGRLKDRYAFQVVRALFASHRYEDCVKYYDSVFPSLPDSNLMKRMAQRYVAGCWRRLGNCSDKADSIFATVGDIWSIGAENPVEYMMKHNPNAPQIIEFIRSQNANKENLEKIIPIAKDALKKQNIENKGDWSYLLAYYYNEYAQDDACAKRYIKQAIKNKFSTEELHDLARAYKMKIDSHACNFSNLLSDLKWLEKKCDVLNPDAIEWIRRVRNILYVDWIPRLWEKKDYATAILLASYADNLEAARQWQEVREAAQTASHSISTDIMRRSEEYTNTVDYGSLSFQMMGSLTSSQLARTYKQMMDTKPLYRFLRKNCRTDSDYYNELIGTLALREEKYSRAIEYLSKVSKKYQRTMNIYKKGYLGRNPFYAYPSRWNVNNYSDCEYESTVGKHSGKSFTGAKLDFAKKMRKYQQQMKNGKTGDERGWARLMYATGRRNSFEECWALTQYWRGFCDGIFGPTLYYGETHFEENNYNFLYDYEHKTGHAQTEALYQQEVTKVLAMIQSNEMRAKAEYFLGNVKSVLKKYPYTTTANLIKTSCDNWKSWL